MLPNKPCPCGFDPKSEDPDADAAAGAVVWFPNMPRLGRGCCPAAVCWDWAEGVPDPKSVEPPRLGRLPLALVLLVVLPPPNRELPAPKRDMLLSSVRGLSLGERVCGW